MIFFGSKAKEPIAGGAGGNGCLIHATNGEAVAGLAVHGAARFLVLIIEGTAVLVHHDAILLERTEAVTIKLLGKQSCRMAQWVDSIVDNQIIFINLGAQKAQAISIKNRHPRIVQANGVIGEKVTAHVNKNVVRLHYIDFFNLRIAGQLTGYAAVTATYD